MPTRVLIVDDDPADRLLLARAIGRHGDGQIACADANGAETALAALAREPYDCVLLDVNMPVVGGIAALRAMRARYPLLAIVLMTGVGSEALTVEALQAGATNFVLKDAFAGPGVITVIDRAIASESAGWRAGQTVQ